MNLALSRELRRVKRLHADRAEEEARSRRVALEAAIAAATAAYETLQDWRADMPRKTAAIYATVIGQVVPRGALEEVTQRALALREHEQLLETRLLEARKAVKTAEEARAASEVALQAARRKLQKFDDIVETLQQLALIEAERREDAELEEAAERVHPDHSLEGDETDNLAFIPDGGHEWNQIA
jgi:type III secretion protein O